MRYHILACDYDGTIAHHGHVGPEMVAAFERLLATGRQLVLVTGRELDELLGIFPEITLFTRVVAENGALLYRPDTKERKLLAEPPPIPLIQALERRNVPLSVGKSILATWRPHESAVLDAIREQGVEWHVIFNKDAVMALPSSVNKATGLAAALLELNLTAHEVVGVGDAENDHAFLSMCACGVSVANALPALKERTDWTTRGDHGIGVAELIEELIRDDLATRKPHHLHLGQEPGPRPYAEGELPPDLSFYFRGREGKLNLRAQNLAMFKQLADGVDDDTWLYHLSNGDYATWLRTTIKNEVLASEVAEIGSRQLSAAESRDAIRKLIQTKHTASLPPTASSAQ